MSQEQKRGERANERPLPAKRGNHANDDEAKPLAEEVEEEMLDQDIPAETGIPPGTDKRPQ